MRFRYDVENRTRSLKAVQGDDRGGGEGHRRLIFNAYSFAEPLKNHKHRNKRRKINGGEGGGGYVN